MATSYWNPTSGNDSNDGLSVANAKLTIGAAETVAGSGGIVKVTSGTHSMSSRLDFAGDRTYESENTSNLTHLEWGDTNGDTLRITPNGDTIVQFLKMTRLRGESGSFGAVPIWWTAGSGNISLFGNVVQGSSTYGGGGQGLGNDNPGGALVGNFTAKYNQFRFFMERGTSTSYLIRNAGTNRVFSNNSIYLESPTDTGLQLTDTTTDLEAHNNIIDVSGFNTPPGLIWSATNKDLEANTYFGDNGAYSLAASESRKNPLFIDAIATNLDLLPTSPVIAAGAGSIAPGDEPTGAGIRYFDTSAGGTNDGTSLVNAWQTEAAMTAGAVAGDVVYVADGEHVVGNVVFTTNVVLRALNERQATLKSSNPSLNFVIQFNADSTNNDVGLIGLNLVDFQQAASANGNCFFVFLDTDSCKDVLFLRNKVTSTQVGNSSKCGFWIRGSLANRGYITSNEMVVITAHASSIELATSPALACDTVGNSFYVSNENATTSRSVFGNFFTGSTMLNNLLECKNSTIQQNVPAEFNVEANKNFSSNTSASANVIDGAVFIDSENGNIDILPTSPAIAAGADGGTDPVGTIYVDPDAGDNANDGLTVGSPKFSLIDFSGDGAETAAANSGSYNIVFLNHTFGGAVTFKGGGYTYDFSQATGKYVFNANLTITGNCTIKGLQYERAPVTGGISTLNGAVDASEVTFEDCDFKHFSTGSDLRHFNSTNVPITFRGCSFRFGFGSGALLSNNFSTSTKATFIGCSFLGIPNPDFPLNSSSPRIPAVTSGANIEYLSCIFKNGNVTGNLLIGSSSQHAPTSTIATSDCQSIDTRITQIDPTAPLFIDAENGNLNLLPTSVAIAVGA